MVPLAFVLLWALVSACATTSAELSPSPSIPTPPTASPTPAPPTGDEIIDLFLALVLDDQFTFHIVVSGTMSAVQGSTREDLTLGMDMDVRGEDGVGDAIVDLGPSEVSLRLLVLDGLGYVEDNGTWTEIPGYESTTPLNPFFRLAGPGDLSYEGYIRRGGALTRHLRSLVWMGGDISELEAQGWTEVTIEESQSDIFVDETGAPIRMDFRGVFTGQYEGVPASFDFDVVYEFSNVAEPVVLPEP